MLLVSVGVNVAVSGWCPTMNVVVVAAVPLATVTGDPIAVAPSRNWTVPATPAVTVAVIVEAGPTMIGLVGVTAREVVVGATAVTVYVVPVEVEAANWVLSVGVKAAVSVCDPGVRVVVDVVAVPPLTATGALIGVAPSKNCTLPAAVVGVIVAVKPTLAP